MVCFHSNVWFFKTFDYFWKHTPSKSLISLWWYFQSMIMNLDSVNHCLSISPYSVRMRENTDQKKLRIWTLFVQWRFYLFKTNNGNTKNDIGKCKMCLKLTVRIPERPQWHCAGVFIVDYQQISHIHLVFPLVTLNK